MKLEQVNKRGEGEEISHLKKNNVVMMEKSAALTSS